MESLSSENLICLYEYKYYEVEVRILNEPLSTAGICGFSAVHLLSFTKTWSLTCGSVRHPHESKDD